MATTDTLCFGDADPVTGLPVIDGLVDYDYLPFDPADPFESGYVNGSRLTFEGGSLARVIFQGVRQAPVGPVPDRIVMGFFCRFDNSFDAQDFIAIAVRSHFASGNARLIAIHPNIAGLGADAGAGAGPNHIKRDVPPTGGRLNFWQGSDGNWTPIASPASVDVKLRSWIPNRPNGAPDEVAWSVEISMPRAAGGDWIDINDDFGLYFNVVRTFQPGNMAVQSAFPTTAADLPEDPGPGFVVPQWGHGLIPAIQVPAGKNTGVGVRFKNGWQGVGRRTLGDMTTSLTGTIEGPAGISDNELVAFIENTGEVAANDITAEFRFANWGLPAATFPAWDLAAGLVPNPTPRRIGIEPPAFDPPVNLAATLQPTMPTSATLHSPWPRLSVPVEYANHKHQCLWVQLNSATTVNFTQSSVRRNMDFDHFSDIDREAEVSGEGYPEPADGSDAHDFVIQTYCRAINVAELLTGKQVDPEAQALIEGAIAQAPRGDFNADVPPTSTHGGGGSSIKNTVIYVWVAQGYRRTGSFIKIKGQVFENLDHTPGQFGIAASHQGLSDPFHYALNGPGLVQYEPGTYGLKVPHKGRTRIQIRLGADSQGPGGDRSDVPKAPWPKPEGIGPGDGSYGHGGPGEPGDLPKGCLALLMRLLGLGK